MTGLRERKKARTKAEIRAHALRLFRERGYGATTVDQIAEAAEVSPSTFFRYFPTKEDVVIEDETDPLIIAAFHAQPAGMAPLTALREAIREVYADVPPEARAAERERQLLISTVPELRARMLDEFVRAVELVAGVMAERTGRARNDIAVTTLAGAVIGIGIAALVAYRDNPELDMIEHFDAGLAQLQAGLEL
jgi:AcrR family transcriptional regulator